MGAYSKRSRIGERRKEGRGGRQLRLFTAAAIRKGAVMHLGAWQSVSYFLHGPSNCGLPPFLWPLSCLMGAAGQEAYLQRELAGGRRGGHGVFLGKAVCASPLGCVRGNL